MKKNSLGALSAVLFAFSLLTAGSVQAGGSQGWGTQGAANTEPATQQGETPATEGKDATESDC